MLAARQGPAARLLETTADGDVRRRLALQSVSLALGATLGLALLLELAAQPMSDVTPKPAAFACSGHICTWHTWEDFEGQTRSKWICESLDGSNRMCSWELGDCFHKPCGGGGGGGGGGGDGGGSGGLVNDTPNEYEPEQ